MEAFKSNNKKERSDTVILVKNIPFGMEESDIRDLFGKFGDLIRVSSSLSGACVASLVMLMLMLMLMLMSIDCFASDSHACASGIRHVQ